MIDKLNTIDGITVNTWEKHGKSRIYINLTQSQNRFPAYSGKLFIEDGQLVIVSQCGIREDAIRKSECAGAKTYQRNLEIIEQIKAVL